MPKDKVYGKFKKRDDKVTYESSEKLICRYQLPDGSICGEPATYVLTYVDEDGNPTVHPDKTACEKHKLWYMHLM